MIAYVFNWEIGTAAIDLGIVACHLCFHGLYDLAFCESGCFHGLIKVKISSFF